MKKLIILACLLSCSVFLKAQDAQPAETTISDAPFNQVTIWDFIFGVGYNYRKFHKVKLYKDNNIPSNYYSPNGRTRRDPLPGDSGYPRDPHDYDDYNDDHDHEHEHHGHATPLGMSDFGARDCSGVEVNFGVPCFRHDAWRVDALLGFMYYDCDTKLSIGGDQTRYEMQMHTYDIGAKASYKINDHFSVSASLGPSFNFLDLDSSSNGHSSNHDSLEMGVFAAAGIQFWVTKSIGVGAEVRYDKVFEDVDTRYSSLDLDTWNTDFKFLFRF
ncbi:MAG: autotransporter domain-containing protein [Lentisphaeria bacterium]|nr:autotransporter domain-containing protein [Lentisphaeria bacterium]